MRATRHRRPSLAWHVVLMVTYLIPAMALAGIGLFLCLTIVGIVPGVFLMVLSGAPIAYEVNRYGKKMDAWREEQRGEERFRTGRGKAGKPNLVLVKDLDYEYDPVLDTMVLREKPWNE
jgi:uncharacterized membrane protein